MTDSDRLLMPLQLLQNEQRPVVSRALLFCLLLTVQCLLSAIQPVAASEAVAASKPVSDMPASDLLKVYQSIKSGQPPLLNDQPVRIISLLNENRLEAEVFAIRPLNFQTLVERLSQPQQWCQLVTLHLNIKACVYEADAVRFYAGRKFYQPAVDAYELRYRFLIERHGQDLFQLKLSAAEGPFGTSDYLIRLQAMRVGQDVLLHFSLGYNTSMASRIGTNVYLSTIGSEKIGFSRYQDELGDWQFIKDVEAIIERNVMRYFLALDVYFAHETRAERIDAWFAATEQYSAQLYEVEKAEYIEAKRLEFGQQEIMQQRFDKGLPVFSDESE